MIKFAIEQWDKNKDRLKEDINNNIEAYNTGDYKTIVEKVTEFIFNDLEDSNEDYDSGYDFKKITEIDNGDYQGTLLYLIPENTYQPDEAEYLMTYVGYGSCSGCDTLQAIEMWEYDKEDDPEEYEKDKERFIKDIMSLSLDLVQNTIKPYNTGWRQDKKFDTIED